MQFDFDGGDVEDAPAPTEASGPPRETVFAWFAAVTDGSLAKRAHSQGITLITRMSEVALRERAFPFTFRLYSMWMIGQLWSCLHVCHRTENHLHTGTRKE